MPVAYTTAWSSLFSHHPKLQSGQTVLCLGTGGVSLCAAQVSHLYPLYSIVLLVFSSMLVDCRAVKLMVDCPGRRSKSHPDLLLPIQTRQSSIPSGTLGS